jgi:hypothetical protein
MGKLEFGAAFSRVFDLYAKHAAPLLIWSAVFQGALALVVAIFVTGVIAGGSMALLAFPLILALGLVAGALMTGAYIVGLHEASQTGSFPGFGSVWPKVSSRIGPLILTSLLAAVGVFLGLLALVIPGLVLLTWWAVISPVVMLEDKSGTAALGRSRELVSGNGWTVFGLLIVTGILTGIASSIITNIVGGIFGGSDEILGSFAGQFVSGTLLAPVSALLAVVMYEALSGGPSGTDVEPPTYREPEAPTPPPTDGPSGPFV